MKKYENEGWGRNMDIFQGDNHVMYTKSLLNEKTGGSNRKEEGLGKSRRRILRS